MLRHVFFFIENFSIPPLMNKVNMPNGKMGVVCGIKDVDDDVRESNKLQEALRKTEQTRAVNRRLVEEVQSAAKLADLMGSVASLMSNIPAMSFSKEAETGKYLACNQSFAEYYICII